jgi:hypothetical protein
MHGHHGTVKQDCVHGRRRAYRARAPTQARERTHKATERERETGACTRGRLTDHTQTLAHGLLRWGTSSSLTYPRAYMLASRCAQACAYLLCACICLCNCATVHVSVYVCVHVSVGMYGRPCPCVDFCLFVFLNVSVLVCAPVWVSLYVRDRERVCVCARARTGCTAVLRVGGHCDDQGAILQACTDEPRLSWLVIAHMQTQNAKCVREREREKERHRGKNSNGRA